MSAFADLVRFIPTAGGTTDWVYSSAVGGCQAPSAANVQNGVSYKVYAVSADLTQWEISTGVYNSSTGTFPRSTVLYNSAATGTAAGQSGAGTKINFATVPQVSVIALAEDLISVEVANSFTAAQQLQARKNIAAAAATWTIAVITASNAAWPVPANTVEMIIEAWSGGGSGAGQSGGTQRGAGGGSGAYGYKYYTGTMDSTLNITVGAGGSSVSGSGGNNGAGTSIAGANLGNLGLSGGSAPGATGFGANGGPGGAASGPWTFSIAGGQGTTSGPTSSPGAGAYGLGGDAPRGGQGGKANVGQPGAVPGGGGAGENHAGGGSGAGAAGEVIIWTR
ncbi:hypothetical protein [Bradyrhizobium sp.]|uniref:glycine-rich domain-containing protein n=1 Tax=Bradyrhizobium sp. TaxID=376 RepID=UPI003C397C96